MNRGLLQRSYYPALDGMRGMAILLVVVYHNFNFINYSTFGWLGVDLFFVLSGYLITGILLKTLGTKHYLRNFYIKRILRIFPLYYLTLIVLLLVLPALLHKPQIFDYYTTHQFWLWTFLENWLYIFNPPTGLGILNHFWSLAVEEQFYLVWPFILLLLKKPKYILIFLSLVLLLVMAARLYIWINQIENLSYYNLYTFSRIDGICIGCMVALIQKMAPHFLSSNTTLIVVTFAGLNFLFDFINQLHQFSFPFLATIGYTTFAMLFGLLVNEATARNNKWINLIFTNSILKFFGKISFGLYVFHWPIYLLLKPAVEKWLKMYIHSYVYFITSFFLTAIAVGVSILSYQLFEKRFLNLKNKFITN